MEGESRRKRGVVVMFWGGTVAGRLGGGGQNEQQYDKLPFSCDKNLPRQNGGKLRERQSLPGSC